MEKILAILAREKEYADELAEYMSSKKDFDFNVVTFSKGEQLKTYEQNHVVNMLLCDEEVALTSASEYRTDNICILSEYSFVNEHSVYPSIFKYQSADTIMKEIVQLYSKRELCRAASEAASRIKKLRCVCSPAGGVYKSTFALALAQYLSKSGRTLFISFDPFFTFPCEVKRAEDKNFTDVIYYLEQSCRKPVEFVADMAKKSGNLEYISGVSHWYDIFDLEAKHADRLLKALCDSDYYDSIVIDAGIMGVSSLEVLLKSEIIYVPSKEGQDDSRKINEWMRQISFAAAALKMEKIEKISIPFDEGLSCSDYGMEHLLSGNLGRFIEKMEGER